MTTAERRLIRRLTLRQLGRELGVEIRATDADRALFDRWFDVPLRFLAAQFKTERAFCVFVRTRLDEAFDRQSIARIAAIFDLRLAA